MSKASDLIIEAEEILSINNDEDELKGHAWRKILYPLKANPNMEMPEPDSLKLYVDNTPGHASFRTRQQVDTEEGPSVLVQDFIREAEETLSRSKIPAKKFQFGNKSYWRTRYSFGSADDRDRAYKKFLRVLRDKRPEGPTPSISKTDAASGPAITIHDFSHGTKGILADAVPKFEKNFNFETS